MEKAVQQAREDAEAKVARAEKNAQHFEFCLKCIADISGRKTANKVREELSASAVVAIDNPDKTG